MTRRVRRVNLLRFIFPSLAFLCLAALCAGGQQSSSETHSPLRVGIVGLVHGHVHGFLDQSRHSADIEIVGIEEPNADLLAAAASRYRFSREQLYSNLEDMIAKAHPQAVLVYTNTFDHR